MPINSPKYDFLIIGQGLAGSLLAWQLHQQQQSVLLLDNNHQGSASTVAAGIINPVTGHRINVTDHIDELLPVAKDLYKSLAEYFDQRFLHEIQQYRLIKNPGQLEYWQQRKQQSSHQAYLGDRHSRFPPFKNTVHGVCEIRQSFYVTVKALLDKLRAWLIAQHAYQNVAVDYQTIDINEDGITVGNIKAKCIIFCEGYQSIFNPWFKHLPFRLSKGEILQLHSPSLPKKLLNWGQWLLPDAQYQQFKTGSNYAWNTLDLSPSNDVRDKLINSLLQSIEANVEVINHYAGIRPTTRNRKPFIGPHPEHNKLYCFNGFGSKGCLSIPYYTKLFSSHLLEGQPLPNEVTSCL